MRSWVRRIVLDLLIGGVVLIVTFPVTIVLAIGSAISLRAWPIFTQVRLGTGGKPFKFLKVRSLPVAAPKYATKYEIEHVHCPRFGKFLRSTHLDELPQLVLVVAGRMSLVGPRPEMKVVSDSFDPTFVAARLRLRPGCTGLWQISVDANKMIGEHPEYDLYYIQHSCLRLDLWIGWRTAVQLVPGVGSVTLDDVPRWTRARALYDDVTLDLTQASIAMTPECVE